MYLFCICHKFNLKWFNTFNIFQHLPTVWCHFIFKWDFYTVTGLYRDWIDCQTVFKLQSSLCCSFLSLTRGQFVTCLTIAQTTHWQQHTQEKHISVEYKANGADTKQTASLSLLSSPGRETVAGLNVSPWSRKHHNDDNKTERSFMFTAFPKNKCRFWSIKVFRWRCSEILGVWDGRSIIFPG